eukprot:UN29236
MLFVLMFVFFLSHNWLQEYILALEGFEYPSLLALFEIYGLTTGLVIERYLTSGMPPATGNTKDYLFISILLLISSGTSNLSLSYVNFPTKVIFRSSKLLPTMLMGLFSIKLVTIELRFYLLYL